MIFIGLAAVAAASNHSVRGAFGFTLGSSPGPSVFSCEKNDYPEKTQMYVCPGDDFFSRVFVTVHRGEVVMISGSRIYDAGDVAVSKAACFADLGPLKQTIDAKYPKLSPARASSGFKMTEELYMNLLPIGRSIEGDCKEIGRTDRRYYALWLTYTHSDEEGARLRRLDDAERLKAKGLNPDAL